MRKPLASLLVAIAAFQSSALAFNNGDALTPDALGKADIIQGEIPKTWEPGKVYILECWATWCGPCVAAIPHVDALYDKYKDKGLRVIGVNVWEDGKDKVADFVKKKGDGMSYPVIYTGKSGTAFESDYLKPGNVKGIPRAFVIKDGKYLFDTHPDKITDAVVEALFVGGEAEEKTVKELLETIKQEVEQRKQTDQLRPLLMAFKKAADSKDVNAMAVKLAEIEKLDCARPLLPKLQLSLMAARKEWPALERALEERQHLIRIFDIAVELDEATDVPKSTRESILAKLKSLQPDPMVWRCLNLILQSRYQWHVGDKEAAKTSAKKAIDNARDTVPVDPFAAYTRSLDEENPQTANEVIKATFEAMQRKK